MYSSYFGGTLPMKIDGANAAKYEDVTMGMGEYPFYVPDVYLEGRCEIYESQSCFDWMDDSVVLVRECSMTEYTRSDYCELLRKDEEGNMVWVDGRNAPHSDCLEREYLGEVRNAREYTITEYDWKTYEKRKYKLVLDNTSKIDEEDFSRLAKFLDTEQVTDPFAITK